MKIMNHLFLEGRCSKAPGDILLFIVSLGDKHYFITHSDSHIFLGSGSTMATSLHERKHHPSVTNQDESRKRSLYSDVERIGGRHYDNVRSCAKKPKVFEFLVTRTAKTFALYFGIMFLLATCFMGYKEILDIDHGSTNSAMITLLTKSNFTTDDVAARAVGESTRVQEKRVLQESKGQTKVSLVISYCDKPMQWIAKFIGQKYQVTDISIVSKCTDHVEGLEALQEISSIVNVMRLPTIGYCDHSYVYWIKEKFSQINRENEDDIVVVMKDDDYNNRKFRRFSQVFEIAKDVGFGCFMKPDREELGLNALMLHDKASLDTFAIDDYSRVWSNQRNVYPFKGRDTATFLDWRKKIDASYPDSDFLPVCYGGYFATRRKGIKTQSLERWKKFGSSLLRGSDIEENQFTERAWAPFLTSPEEVNRLKLIAKVLDPVIEKAIDDKVDKNGVFIAYNGMLLFSKKSDEFKSIAQRWLL